MKILINRVDSEDKRMLTYFNQYCFNIYSTNYNYRTLLEEHFIIYAADFGMSLALKILVNGGKKSINGTDFNAELIKILLDKEMKFFILGGNFNNLDINRKFGDKINLVKYHSGYFQESEFERIVVKIKDHNPEVVLIGMGVPKQEFIAKRLAEQIDGTKFLCVGNFLEFYFGTVKRIPERWRNSGFEWVYRLWQEPKRLWKRYIIGIPLFIFRVLKIKFTQKKF